MTLVDLARDLALTKARVTQLREQGLVVQRRDGKLNQRATLEWLYLYWLPSDAVAAEIDQCLKLERLYLYWLPSDSWWNRPVGSIGQRLREHWRRDEQRAGIHSKDLLS